MLCHVVQSCNDVVVCNFDDTTLVNMSCHVTTSCTCCVTMLRNVCTCRMMLLHVMQGCHVCTCVVRCNIMFHNDKTQCTCVDESCPLVYMYCNMLQWCCYMLYMYCARIVHVRKCCSIMHMLRYNVTMLRWWQHMCNHVASCCTMWQLSEFICTFGIQWCTVYDSLNNIFHWCFHMFYNVTSLSPCKLTCCSMMYDCISMRTYIITGCMLGCRKCATLQHVRWCRTCYMTYVHMSRMWADNVWHSDIVTK